MSVEKIGALLAKAESTDNEAEREAYMAKAQMLATTHSIDLAFARANATKATRREELVVRQVTIATEPGKDINKHLVMLASATTRVNDVRMNIYRSNTRIECFGFASDIDVAETMIGALAHQMVAAADAYIKSGEWKGQTYWGTSRDSWGYAVTENKTYTARSARNAFYAGWIERIGERLAKARRDAIKAHDEAPTHAPTYEAENAVATPVSTSAELVLKTKTEEVGDYYKTHSRAKGSWSGSNAARGGTAGRAGTSAANGAHITARRGLGGKAGAIG
jgi:hypothetical protein